MGKMFDSSTPLTYEQAKAFFDQGFTHVARYLYHGWKGLTKKEALDISRAGLIIVSVYEVMGDLASMTASQGTLDGQTSLVLAKEVGQPDTSVNPDSTIYFTADFKPTPQDLPNVLTYIRACSEATPDYKTGAYGNYDVIQYVAINNGCSHFWQTYAWSYGYISEYNNIYQDENGVILNGMEVDDDVISQNVGGWQVFEEVVPTPEPTPAVPTPMSTEDAKKFAAMAAALFKLDAHEISYSDGTVYSNMDHDEYHRLANVARALGGLTIV